MSRFQLAAVLFLAVPFFTACSFSRIASNLTSGIMKSGQPIMEEESDIEVAEQSSVAMIKTLEVFYRHNPDNETFLFLLSKSYGSYSFGFLENRLLEFKNKDPQRFAVYEERAKLFYLRGKEYGLKYIERRDKGLRRAIDQGLVKLREELSHTGKGDLEALFWTAFNWGNYINLTKDSVRSVSDLTLVEAMMARVMELDPNYLYGGPHLFYGVYYGSSPPMLGGNPEQARKHFESAAKTSEGKMLMTMVLEAQVLAVQLQDRELFDRLLGQVEEGSIEAIPEQRMANVLAKERARLLRENAKNYF